MSTPALLAMRSSSRHLSHPSVHGTGSGRTMLVQRRSPEFTCIGLVYRYAVEPRSSALPSLSQGMLQWADRIADAAFIARTLQVSMGATGYFACERLPEPQPKTSICCEPPAATSGAGSKAHRTFVDSIRPTLAFRLDPDLNFSSPGAGKTQRRHCRHRHHP